MTSPATVEFLEKLQSTPVGLAVGETWFPFIESLHVIAMAHKRYDQRGSRAGRLLPEEARTTL